MAIQTTTSPTINSIIARYNESYLKGAKTALLYDQIAVDYTKFTSGMSMQDLMRSSAVYIPFRSGMQVGTSTISETADITPQVRYDANVAITPTSRGEALQWSQQLKMQAFDEFTAGAYETIGENCMETIEALAIDTALAGTWNDSYAARANLDAGTAAHNATDAIFRRCDGLFQSMRVPGYEGPTGVEWSCIAHPWAIHDVMEGGKVVYVAEYQQGSIILNWELAKLGRFKLVPSPFAKVFMGAGADHDTNVATTLNGAVTRLAKTIVTAADVSANIAKGFMWTIGTEETGNTFYPMNERIVPLSASTVTITANGQGDNGGLRYDHATGAAVRNADSVYPLLFCGPQSMVKLYATDPESDDPDARAAPGVKGAAIVGPLKTGLAHQWDSLAWKFWGGYGLISQNRIYRYEVSSSYEHST